MTKDYRTFAQGFLQGCRYESTAQKHQTFLAAINATYVVYMSQDDETKGTIELEDKEIEDMIEGIEEALIGEVEMDLIGGKMDTGGVYHQQKRIC